MTYVTGILCDGLLHFIALVTASLSFVISSAFITTWLPEEYVFYRCLDVELTFSAYGATSDTKESIPIIFCVLAVFHAWQTNTFAFFFFEFSFCKKLLDSNFIAYATSPARYIFVFDGLPVHRFFR